MLAEVNPIESGFATAINLDKSPRRVKRQGFGHLGIRVQLDRRKAQLARTRLRVAKQAGADASALRGRRNGQIFNMKMVLKMVLAWVADDEAYYARIRIKRDVDPSFGNLSREVRDHGRGLPPDRPYIFRVSRPRAGAHRVEMLRSGADNRHFDGHGVYPSGDRQRNAPGDPPAGAGLGSVEI